GHDVRLHAEHCLRSQSSFAAGLHLLVDDHHVATLAIREKRGAKSKAVDLTFHPELATHSPDFWNIQRNVNHGPVQAVSTALQCGRKRFPRVPGIGHKHSLSDSAGKEDFTPETQFQAELPVYPKFVLSQP